MIWNFEVRHYRFTEALNFNILRIIFSNRNRRINDVRNHHHSLLDFILKLFLALFQILEFLLKILYLLLGCFSLVLLAFSHQKSDFLGDPIAVAAKCIAFCLCITELLVEFSNFIN